ncbi:FtsX-like permease family protein [Scardovia wiggsiae]|uniref:FtsX-like permease family protein n=1 Tax=Scardovia wiggsiae TaxID=230143 RepID=UPI0036125DC7
MNFRTLTSLMRSSREDRRINTLAVIAFAVSMGVFLTVMGGFHAFLVRSQNAAQIFSDREVRLDADGYIFLASIAAALIVAPLITLSAHATRLTLRRRDRRLSILRLIGATQSQTTLLTVAESASQALAGSLVGCLLYIAAIPLVRLLVFQGVPFTFSQLWVGVPLMLAAVAVITLICVLSALFSLHRVNVTPLGVSMRASGVKVTKRRAIIGAALFLIVLIAFSMRLGKDAGYLVMGIVGAAGLGISVGVLNLVGPWVIKVWAKICVRHPRSAASLIGLRRLLDDPKRAWRSTAGVGLAIFVCSITAAAASAAGTGGQQRPSQVIASHDVGLGGMLTLGFVALLAAVSAMVTQSAMVYDQSDQYISLALEGADRKILDKARRIETVTPLLVITVISALMGLLLLSPAGAAGMKVASFLPTYLGMVTACVLLIILGGMASHIASRQVARQMVRQDD